MFLVIQVSDIVDCCKYLCSSFCTTVQACYGPCANAHSASDLVYGMPARDAVMQAEDVLLCISDMQER